MAESLYTAQDAAEALQHIDPGMDRQSWVRVMASAKAAGLTFEDVLAWSAGAANHKGERDVQTAWRSIDESGPVQAGTLYHLARAAGWRPAQVDRGRSVERHPAIALAHHDAPRSERKVAIRPGMSAAKLWDAAAPATPGHGYIVRKNGRPDGLRVCAGGLTIAGNDMAGALLVPVRTLDGELVSLQAIPEDASRPKMNLPGHPMAGVHLVGELEPSGTAYVVEGIGQAWACWQATGQAAVVTFGAGRFKAVAELLRASHPGLAIVLVPDAGQEPQAQAIAQVLECRWVAMPEGSPKNYDANDHAQAHGAEGLAELLAGARDVEPPPLPLSVAFADELPADYQPPDELVEGLLVAGEGSILYGDSNTGKTFLVLDLAAAVARGVDWMGRRVQAGMVVYLAAESPASVRQRLQAYQTHHGVKVPDFAIVQSPVDLFAGDDDTEAILFVIRHLEKQRGKPVALVVGDTLARLSAGANENAGQDMGLVIKRVDRIRAETGAHLILVHHSGKNAAQGARGWSGVRAAVDTELELTDTPTGRCCEVTKQRTIPGKGERIGFDLKRVHMGRTKWGGDAYQCVVTPTDAPEKPQGKKLGMSEGAVLEFLKARGTGISIAAVVKHFDGKPSRPTVYRAIEKLQAVGMVHVAPQSGMVCIAEAEK